MVSCRQILLGLVTAGLMTTLGMTGSCTGSAPTAPQSSEASATQTRGDRTSLRLLYGQAPKTLNPHLATGLSDFEAGRIVLEPLATATATGEWLPILAAEMPTLENGGLAADGRSVTWKLRPDLSWSDGTPLTAADVVFTFEFVTDPEVGAATAQYYQAVESVTAIDDQTVRVTFKQATAAWRIPFTGQTGVILPQHFLESAQGVENRGAAANVEPIGTGPYRVQTFQAGKVVYAPNPYYRDPQAVHFERLELVGGIPPATAAQEVLSTSAADFAHNLQVEVDLLAAFQAEGQAGRVMTVFGGLVEQLMLNPTDPFQATASGERSSMTIPHPFLSDQRVRQAIAHAIDRDRIAADLYGFTGRPSSHLLVAPQLYANPRPTPYPYDVERAQALLTEAGWVDSDGDSIRDRQGVDLQVVFQTSVNPVRQKTQTLIQENLRAIGIDVELKRVRVDDFFSADPDQTNSINHFYADMQAYTIGNDHPDPSIYLSWWTCDQIARQANRWQKPNNARYCNPEYDALWETAQQALIPEKRAALFQELDALLVKDVAMIPLVHRAMANGVSTDLVGLEPTPWDASTWDIAHWRRAAAAADDTR